MRIILLYMVILIISVPICFGYDFGDTAIFAPPVINYPVKLAVYKNILYAYTTNYIKKYNIVKYENGVWRELLTPEFGYETKDSIYIEDIVIDNSGNLWAAMNGRLMKFDGLEWRVFINKEVEHNPPIIRNYKKIMPDSKGNLWIISQLTHLAGYYNGFEIFTRISTEFSKFTNWEINTVYSCKVVPDTDYSLFQFDALTSSVIPSDGKEYAWLAAKSFLADSLLRFSVDDCSRKSFALEDAFEKDNSSCVTKMCPDEYGNLWFSQSLGGYMDVPVYEGMGGFSKYNTVNGTWKHYTKEDSFKSNFQQSMPYQVYKMTTVAVDSNNYKWAGSENGVVVYDDKSFTLLKLEDFSDGVVQSKVDKILLNSIRDVAVTEDGTVWIANFYGLVKIAKGRVSMEENKNTIVEKKVYVFPNPIRKGNIVNFKIGNSIKKKEMFITNFVGKKIFPKIVNIIENSDESIISIDTEDYSPGSHWFIVQGDNEINVASFIVF